MSREKIGGRAYKNGVMLTNGERSVKAYYDKNDNLRLQYRKMRKSKLLKYINKIPILRGIAVILSAVFIFIKESVNEPKKYWFIFLIIIIDIIFLFLPASSSQTADKIIILLYIAVPLILVFIFKDTILEVLRFHGAEHKTVNYYEKKFQKDINSYSRLHKRCGSNIVFYYIIISFVTNLFSFKLNLILQEIIIIGLAYEAVRYTPDKLLFLPYLFQRLVTKEPEKKHINAASAALKALVENYGLK